MLFLSKKVKIVYEEIEQIGEGAKSEVYAVRSSLDNKIYALKKVNFKELNRREKKHLNQEVSFLKKLKHRNLVTYVDHYQVKEFFCIVFKMYKGQTLEHIIDSDLHHSLSQQRKISIIVDIVKALGYLHDNNIIHRDVKPGNIFVTQQQGLLLDLGIACHPKQSKNRKGFIYGSPYYMSPKQVENQILDPQSDIFSLGSVIYEFYTGKKAFFDISSKGVMMKVQRKQTPNISRSFLPEPIAEILEKCWRKNKKSYKNCQDLLGDLEYIEQ